MSQISQVRPLHFARKSNGFHYVRSEQAHLPVAYGIAAYVTANRLWTIRKLSRGWITVNQAYNPGDHNPFHEACHIAGIYDICFPRRIDAVKALEAIIAAEEKS